MVLNLYTAAHLTLPMWWGQLGYSALATTIWNSVRELCISCKLCKFRAKKGKGSHRRLRNYTGFCHFPFLWLCLRFELTFPAAWGPCGSCKVQMFSCRNVAHILLIWETHEWGTGRVGSWIVTLHIPLSSQEWACKEHPVCFFHTQKNLIE